METSGNRTALGVSSDIAQLIGNRLRRAREAIGRSTSMLSAKIKVREHYLVAIEEGLWNELPPGLNGRGLVRIYARELSVSVPELDQAANQSVMPAEQDAQAPYQVTHKKELPLERDLVSVKNTSDVLPQIQRSVDMPVKTTSTLNSVQRNTRNTDSQTQADTRRLSASQSFHKVIESTPEEEPLDVVTPDVASILGITLDVLEDTPKPKLARETVIAPVVSATVATPVESPQNQIATAATAQSEVNASESNRSVSTSHKKSKKQSKNRYESRVETAFNPAEEAPLVMSGSPLSSGASESRAAEPVVAQQDAVKATETVATVNHIAMTEKETSVPDADSQSIDKLMTPAIGADNAEIAAGKSDLLSPSPAFVNTGVEAAETYLKNHHPTSDPAVSNSIEVKSNSKATRLAVGLMAACVGAFIIGQIFIRPNTSEITSDQTSAVVENKTQESPKLSEGSSAPGVDTTQLAPENSSSAVEVSPLPKAAEIGTSSGAAAEKNPSTPQTAPAQIDVALTQGKKTTVTQGEGTAAAQKSDDVAAGAAQETADEEIEDSTSRNRITETTGSSVATLTLSEALEIQITADGKRIFSGKHDPGKLEVKFNNRAEIFVQDGSKAKLKYAGWDHGALGQLGRKRRIVLNAQTFSGSGN